MDALKALNDAAAYVETCLCGELDEETLSRIACTGKDGFSRFFSYITGMSLGEYVRRRRLTLAARELRASDVRVVDVAVKYGWDSANAFSKAFFRQHGITPTRAREPDAPLVAYPPVSFRIAIRGAKGMNLQIVERVETEIYGVSRSWDERAFGSREELRHDLWSEARDDAPGRICGRAYDGVWYGLWRDGRYAVARERADATGEGLERHVIPAGACAVFTTEPGARAWVALPALFDEIFDAWLPDSGYKLRGDWIVERYHLWTDPAARAKNRYYEVWIPVTPI